MYKREEKKSKLNIPAKINTLVLNINQNGKINLDFGNLAIDETFYLHILFHSQITKSNQKPDLLIIPIYT